MLSTTFESSLSYGIGPYGEVNVTPGPTSPPAQNTPTPVPKTPTPIPNTPTPVPKTPTPVSKTPTPIPNTPTPVPKTPTPVPKTPTPGPTSCSSYCVSLGGYTGGTCRASSTACVNNGQVYQSGGNYLCTGGTSSDSCCCTPRIVR